MYQFWEGRTKVRSEVRIDPQSLSYVFFNEIMDHPYSDGGSESDRIECTKFFKGCTNGSKVHSEVGMSPQSLSYGFLNKIMDHPIQMGVPEVIGSDVPYLMMDVPNFVKDVPRAPKCILRWGSAP